MAGICENGDKQSNLMETWNLQVQERQCTMKAVLQLLKFNAT